MNRTVRSLFDLFDLHFNYEVVVSDTSTFDPRRGIGTKRWWRWRKTWRQQEQISIEFRKQCCKQS